MYTLPGDGVNLGGGSYYGAFVPQLCELLDKGFNLKTAVQSLKTQDFSAQGGGYTDTKGISLATILKEGLAIPVYSD